MTNKERLISFLGFKPEPDAIDGALIDVGIDGTDDYDLSNSVLLKTAAIGIMELLLTTPDTTDGTSGFSKKYDRAAVEKRIKLFKGEIGLSDESLPTIKNKSFMW